MQLSVNLSESQDAMDLVLPLTHLLLLLGWLTISWVNFIHHYMAWLLSYPSEHSQQEKRLCFAHWYAITTTTTPSLRLCAGNLCWGTVKGTATSSPCAQEDQRPPQKPLPAPPTRLVDTQRKWQEQYQEMSKGGNNKLSTAHISEGFLIGLIWLCKEHSG